MIAGEGTQRVPGHLRIIVAMVIDETGRHHEAIDINGARRRAAEFADRDNFAVAHGDIAAEGRYTGAINDSTVLNQEIIRHRLFLLVMRRWVTGQRTRGDAGRAPALSRGATAPPAHPSS